jgi:hypothetical protein
MSAIEAQMANNIAELVRRKPHVQRHGEIMQPNFDFFIAGTNMNVSGLAWLIGIEKGPIRTPPQSALCPHSALNARGTFSAAMQYSLCMSSASDGPTPIAIRRITYSRASKRPAA